MERIFQAIAWLLLLAIVVLSLVPPSVRPVTGAPHGFEHFLVFFPTGLSFGLGYPTHQFYRTTALVVFTGMIELAQLWTPGRHARLSDFIVDALGMCVGVGVAALLARFRFMRLVVSTKPHN